MYSFMCWKLVNNGQMQCLFLELKRSIIIAGFQMMEFLEVSFFFEFDNSLKSIFFLWKDVHFCWLKTLHCLNIPLTKSQLISKAIFHGFPYSKIPTKFCTFFPLVKWVKLKIYRRFIILSTLELQISRIVCFEFI